MLLAIFIVSVIILLISENADIKSGKKRKKYSNYAAKETLRERLLTKK